MHTHTHSHIHRSTRMPGTQKHLKSQLEVISHGKFSSERTSRLRISACTRTHIHTRLHTYMHLAHIHAHAHAQSIPGRLSTPPNRWQTVLAAMFQTPVLYLCYESIHIYWCMCAYINICIYVYTYIFEYIHMCIYIYIYICLYIFVYAYICIHVCVRLHTQTHTHTHTHIYIFFGSANVQLKIRK